MDSDNTLKTETFLRRVFKALEVRSEGRVSSEEVGRVLRALGRPQDLETRQNLLNRHGGTASPGLLRDIALYPITDVRLLEEFVFSAAFTTFDQDVDGFISPRDMRGLLPLFLPHNIQKDEERVAVLVERMDRNKDSMIAYEEFVQTIRETGEPDMFRYYDPVLKAAATLIGFVVYCLSFYFGISAVFNCNYD